MEPLYVIHSLTTRKIDPTNTTTDVIMFDGALNVQLVGKLIRNYYPKLTVTRGVEQTVPIYFQ